MVDGCVRTVAGIQETLQMLIGTELNLSDLHTSVVIPSYELETSSPFTFWHKHSNTARDKETGTNTSFCIHQSCKHYSSRVSWHDDICSFGSCAHPRQVPKVV